VAIGLLSWVRSASTVALSSALHPCRPSSAELLLRALGTPGFRPGSLRVDCAALLLVGAGIWPQHLTSSPPRSRRGWRRTGDRDALLLAVPLVLAVDAEDAVWRHCSKVTIGSWGNAAGWTGEKCTSRADARDSCCPEARSPGSALEHVTSPHWVWPSTAVGSRSPISWLGGIVCCRR